MIQIAEEALAAFYINGVAAVLMIGLLYMFRSFKVNEDELSNRLFVLLCTAIIADAILVQIYQLVYNKPTGAPPALRAVLPALDDIAALVVIVLWIIYADYKIFGSKDRLTEKRLVMITPGIIIALLFVINIFVGFMYTVDDMMVTHYTPVYAIVTLVTYAYAFAPVLAELRYRKRYGKMHFFSVAAFLLPMIVFSAFTMATDYTVTTFGFAVGMVFLFFSYSAKWRYDDCESGLYNRFYIHHIIGLAEHGKREYRSALTFRSDFAGAEFFDILKTELPKDGELVRMDENTVLFLTESRKTSTLTLFASLVQEAADEYDEKHPEERALDIIVSMKKRKKSENAAEFVKRVSAA